MIIRSTYDRQDDILTAIKELHCPDGFDADITYGNGSFWKNRDDEPLLRFDIDPQVEGVVEASSISLPLGDNSISSIVFDPPFLTYVRAGREGNGSMIMAKRFGGYWRYDELQEHYTETLRESARVLVSKGIVVFKCQDIIHNHKMHPTHINVVNWSSVFGFRLRDLFILGGGGKLPSPNRSGKQRHARISHS